MKPGPVDVELIPLAEEHTECVLRWRADPEVARWLCSPAPPSREEHLAWLKTLGEKRIEFVILALPERVPVGTIGLSQIDRCHRNAEYGILIGESAYRGRGIALAASGRILDFAFGRLALHRVFLRVMAHNEAALRLYDRIGFVREGVMREQVIIGGVPRDIVVMGILESEWARQP
ncbi:MAG TPA: GNAT family protein [Kiritimatiellia bacterium]|nr:GNAT family protein [Kiritimatiellia bacterium]HMP34409.1 GNAT family protein [Kiritimatiellia bacterium]